MHGVSHAGHARPSAPAPLQDLTLEDCPELVRTALQVFTYLGRVDVSNMLLSHCRSLCISWLCRSLLVDLKALRQDVLCVRFLHLKLQKPVTTTKHAEFGKSTAGRSNGPPPDSIEAVPGVRCGSSSLDVAAVAKQAAEARLVAPVDFAQAAAPASKVVLCMTSMRRNHQIKIALPLMLLQLWPLQGHIVLLLADLNQDEELSDFVARHLYEAVACGLLVSLRSTEMPYWHACRAKNAAGFAAGGLPDVCAVFNMDNDRVVGPDFATHLLRAFLQEGATAVHYTAAWSPGTYGSIGMTTRVWHLLNGYDEEFKPSGCQDTDVLLRMKALGITVVVCRDQAIVGATLPNEEPHEAASLQVKMNNVDPAFKEKWGKMDADNRQLMRTKLAAGNHRANTSPGWAPLRLYAPTWAMEAARRHAPAAFEPARRLAPAALEPPLALPAPALAESSALTPRTLLRRSPLEASPKAGEAAQAAPPVPAAPPPAKAAQPEASSSSQGTWRLAPVPEPVPCAVQACVQRVALFTFGWQKMGKVHPEYAEHWKHDNVRRVTMAMDATGYKMDHIINTLPLHDPAAHTAHLGFSVDVLRGIMSEAHREWRLHEFEKLCLLLRRSRDS